jgi:Tol biopolymer transport system component
VRDLGVRQPCTDTAHHVIVFDSTRPGPLGGPDLWTAWRGSTDASWSAPLHLDAPVSSNASDSRASLSWDGETMVFGSSRAGSEAGSNDVYVVTREKRKGRPD